nr:MAG TPA: hypothetical protein [Crassvirales sp.]
MIDDKKIEEATRDYINKNGYFVKDEEDPCVDIEFAYKEGAKWAINEFLKDLWHPISEEPRKDVSIMVETYNDKNMFYYVWNRWQDNFYPSWTDAILCSRVSRWLYIDALFPKEGGEQ